MDQNIGKLLDNRYELLERIGTGGMAVVYKARCHRLNRLVAIKILKPDLAEDAEIRRRFRDESQAVAMLSHPNIMAVYDVSHSDDLNYIVMELLDGITLKQYMQKKNEPLNWREALHFITQIMKALSHAHSRGIIHRDIKPQNIMVLRDGSIRVTDFGIARLTSSAQATLTQEALGSVHYISPEQARGSRIDNRADIYSAGVVLYEMTTGRLPFEGDTPVAVAIQHINSIPLPPRDLNPDIPEALEAINLKAMAHDMEKRYVSAEAMLADLEEFRKNPDVNFDYARDEFFEEELVDEPTLIRKTDDNVAIRSRRTNAQEENEKDRGNIWPTVIAVGAIVIFFGCIIYFLLSTVFGGILVDNSKELMVPNLIGMTVDEVNRDISEGKIDKIFTVVAGETVISDLPVGQIVRQDPSPNEMKKGEEIIITVEISAGPKQFQMPDLVNEEYRQAIQILQGQMKMKLITDYENSEDVPQNHVIRTEPAEGVNLEPGQVVKIIISLGPKQEMVSVPEFTSQSIEWAINQVRKLGLVVGDVDEKRDTKNEKGTVIFQSIPAYTEVPKGTTISFHISSGVTNDNGATGNPSDDDPVVTTPTPAPTEKPVIATTKTVSIDLSGKTEPVSIRIEVGGNVQFSGTVDPSVVSSPYVKTITGTGQQTIKVYVDDVLVKNYTETFNA